MIFREVPRSVSVLMPTYQADRFLERVLAALAEQCTDFGWDFTAIDCGSTDRTLDIFARFAKSFPVPLRVQPLGRETFDHGDTRNLLAASCSGELLVYLTDDAIPVGKDWLASLRRNFADSRIAAVYCRNVPRPDARPAASVLTLDDPTYSSVMREQRLPSERDLARLSPLELRLLFNYCDTASALRREVWERHPYPRGVGEDVRLARALIEGGHTILFDPRVEVQHSHEWELDRVEARAHVDGAFNAEFLGRICLVDEEKARETVKLHTERDRERLEAITSSDDELEAEIAWAAEQRSAHARGLLAGGRSPRRERGTAMLDRTAMHVLWIATSDELDVADASGGPTLGIARALHDRGNRVSVLALAERANEGAIGGSTGVAGTDDSKLAPWREADRAGIVRFRIAGREPAAIASVVREVAPDLVLVCRGANGADGASESAASLREALGGLPVIVAEQQSWRLFPFGLPKDPGSSDDSRDRIHFRDDSAIAMELDLDREAAITSAIHEYRYRSVLCRARSEILFDRFGRDADRTTGNCAVQGTELMLLGFGPSALEFDVVRGEGDPDAILEGAAFRIEVDVELFAAESDVPMAGVVTIDGRTVLHIEPLSSRGHDDVVRIGADIRLEKCPRVVRVENRTRLRHARRFGWKTDTRLRVRRVRIVRKDAASTARREGSIVRVPATDDPVPIAVVVPHLDGCERLESCLAALGAATYPRDFLDVVVVDNGSRDGSANVVARHPFARQIVNARNLGFTVAANQGAAAASPGSVLVFLNDDCVIERDFLRELVRPITRRECAATGAQMHFPDGTPEFDGGGANFQGIALGRPTSPATSAASNTSRRSLFACGGAMAIDPRVFHDVGGFDPDFFAYYDDLDLGWRLNVMGHDVRYVPSARCHHARSSTSRRFPPEMIRRLQIRNSLFTCVKNYSDAAFDRVFPALLALAARRIWIMARVKDDAEFRAEDHDLHATVPGAARASRIEIDRFAYADMLAINDLLGDMDKWMRKRADVQSRRKRNEGEILPLFVDPFFCVEGESGYVDLQRRMIERYSLTKLFAGTP